MKQLNPKKIHNARRKRAQKFTPPNPDGNRHARRKAASDARHSFMNWKKHRAMNQKYKESNDRRLGVEKRVDKVHKRRISTLKIVP